jgi:ABC-type glycerol-3-phosphate transport system substrate-binding protein
MLISLMTAVFVLAACGGRNAQPEVDPVSLLGTDAIMGLPADTTGEVTVFMWSGSGTFLRDVGRVYIPAEEIMGQNEAAVIATAREFNKMYPNVQVNVYARADGPNDNDIPWHQYRLNFEMEFGHFPDIFAIYDMMGDIESGILADLTIFEEDPIFKAFNPAIMELMNVGGRQWAVPQYLVPWGVFVNRSLAEAQNLDMPTPQWTIEEYFRFISNHSPNEWYGADAPPWIFIDSGTRDFHYQLLNRQDNEPYVRLNSQATRDLLAMMPRAIASTVWPQRSLGNVADEFMDWWWGPRWFQQGRLLAHPGDPWFMGDFAHPDPNHWFAAQMASWDIYPRPSTPYMGVHVGAVIDPMGIRNYAMLDGNPELSAAEYQRLAIAWEFVKFMNGDTRAWAARSRQMFNDDGTMAHASNDSFPFVTGTAFYDQMEYWYQGGRELFRDPARMPGFHYVLEVWNRGDIVANPDKVIPWHHEFEGARREIAHEWSNKYSAEVVGAGEADPHWLDMVLSRLPDWDAAINQRFREAWLAFDEALARFYPVQVRGGR